MCRDFLEARQVSLYELFDGSQYQLDVPEYQRPYAWRAKQASTSSTNSGCAPVPAKGQQQALLQHASSGSTRCD
jgi:hypothetical protein